MKLAGITSAINLGIWITPEGQIVPVNVSHVTDIINNPTKFGLTDQFIQAIYNKHHEPLHMEGEAREELIGIVLNKGWIRVRNYRNYWSVTLHSLTKKIKKTLRDWVSTFVKAKVMGQYEELKILQTGSNNVKVLDADDVLQYALEESVKETPIVTWTEVPDALLVE